MSLNNQNLSQYTYTDKAYITGLLGASSILLMGFLASDTRALISGWNIFGYTITLNKNSTMLIVLALCGLLMFVSEFLIRFTIEKKKLILICEKIKKKKIFFNGFLIGYIFFISKSEYFRVC
jgi:hypothetical protein